MSLQNRTNSTLTNRLNWNIPSGTSGKTISQLENAAGSNGFSQRMLGGQGNLGWLTGGASILGDLAGVWGGYQQIKQAKNQLNFDKSSFNRNVYNQATSLNNSMEQNQATRLAGGGVYGDAQRQAVDAYMQKHKLNGNAI